MTLTPLATQLQNEIEYGDNGMFRKYLIKDQKWQAMLICLRAGIKIPEHTRAYDGFITVIQGRGVFLLAGREVTLEPGSFIELPANTLHGLTALENLAMLRVDSHEPPEPSAAIEKTLCQDRRRANQPNQVTCAESLAEMLKPYLQASAIAESNFTAPPRSESEA